jgi:hypothetical protein
MHLSHNGIGTETAMRLLQALHLSEHYPFVGSRKGQLNPLWLRLEYNRIDANLFLRGCDAAELTFCIPPDRQTCQTKRCGVNKGLAPALHLPFFRSQVRHSGHVGDGEKAAEKLSDWREIPAGWREKPAGWRSWPLNVHENSVCFVIPMIPCHHLPPPKKIFFSLACQIVGLSQLLKGRASRQAPTSEGEAKSAAASRESRSTVHAPTRDHDDDPDAASLADQLERVELTDRIPKDAIATDLRPESVPSGDGSAPGLQLLIVLDSSAIVHMLSTDLELAQAADLGDAQSKRACDALFSFRNLQRLDVRCGVEGGAGGIAP